jgi:hypothetical protein
MVICRSEGLAEDCKTHLKRSILHFWKKNHETENMKFCWRRLFQIQRQNLKTSLALGESLAGRGYKLKLLRVGAATLPL